MSASEPWSLTVTVLNVSSDTCSQCICAEASIEERGAITVIGSVFSAASVVAREPGAVWLRGRSHIHTQAGVVWKEVRQVSSGLQHLEKEK